MKKTNLLIIAVIVILLLLGAWFFIFNKKTSEVGQSTTSFSENQRLGDDVNPGIKESLLGLMEGAAGVKCSVEDTNGKYTVTTKGGKVRIDGMDFPDPQNPTASQKGSMINDGEWAYIWNGKDGMKFNIQESGANGGTNQAGEDKSSDWKGWAKGMEASGAKYDCSPTVATDSNFAPPSDVKFQDLGELMKGLQQMQNNPSVPTDQNPFKIPE